MTENVHEPTVKERTVDKGKRLSRGERIHRRRMLAMQRRTEKGQVVTTRK